MTCAFPQFVFDRWLASRTPGSRRGWFWGLLRRLLVAAGDPRIVYVLGGTPLSLPLSHALPLYRAVYPQYGENIGRLAHAISLRHPDMTVIDIGANVGDTVAILFARARTPVLCIEGHPVFAALLEQNVLRFGDLVVVCRVFVGETYAKAGVLEASGSSRLTDDGSNADVVPFRDVISRYPRFAHARLLKIDTDGFDAAIVRSAKDFLIGVRPVVFFEYDPSALRYGEGSGSAFSVLRDCGYRAAAVYDNNGRFWRSIDLDDETCLAAVRARYGVHGSAPYADIAVFHAADTQLADEFVTAERACAETGSPVGDKA